jgi:hypothetical protein
VRVARSEWLLPSRVHRIAGMSGWSSLALSLGI